VRVLSADWVLPVEAPPIRDGAVALDGDRIVAVGTRDELGEGERFDDAVLVPGFVNVHAHLEYAVYAGFGDGLPFDRWLLVHMERKRRLEDDDPVAIAKLGAAESLRSGITTVADASFTGASAPACAELGLRAIVHLEVFGRDPAAIADDFAPMRDRIADSLSDRVTLGVSPHAPYTVSAELYRACIELGLPVATHLAESEAEDEWLRSGTGVWSEYAALLVEPPGTTGIRVLAEHGLLDRRMVAAHCVLVDDEEIALLAGADVAVAHCPRSNALLGCGVAPVAALREAGIRVGLGTDSPASTPSFDMFEEMRAAVLLARASTRNPGALSADDALELATLGAASALDLDGEVGSLAPGKRADLAVVSLAGSPYLPWEDPAAAVVFGGTPERVELVLVDGEERYRKGGMAWQRLRQSAAKARRRLLADQPLARKT
jgi:cytosine/adenosine deaminase-related metal-dependent hydrolase